MKTATKAVVKVSTKVSGSNVNMSAEIICTCYSTSSVTDCALITAVKPRQ